MVHGRGHYRYVYPFLNWTRAQGMTAPGVRLSPPTYPQRANYLDPAERLSHLRRCLDDDDLPLQVRVAGALTLLFGISITKIVRLSRDDVRAENGIVSLVVGDHQLTVAASPFCRRATVRLTLAAALPGAVLASLTGIEATSADVWTRRVGRDWMP
ncbi:hypothetical protein [Amycolatopsis sp. NPDC051371]|uniref:hypothetical protein n=1 Tax=Amycolatopsis sp. NPDC051371 TaxID=3155800 RepID=UPI0034322D1E